MNDLETTSPAPVHMPPRPRRTRARQRIEKLLAEAENAGRFAIPSCEADRCELRRMRAHGEVTSPLRGAYARRAWIEGLDASRLARSSLRTIGLLHPEWVFSSYSAALLHGLEVPHALLGRAHVCTRHLGCTHSTADVIRHRLREFDIIEIDGLLATNLAQTVLDCLIDAPLRYGLAIADSALRRQGMDAVDATSPFVLDVHALGRGRHGIGTALNTLFHADGRAENGGESVARGIMVERGIMIPDLQVEYPHPFDPRRAPFRVDYTWRLLDGSIKLGELDGVGKYCDEAMLADRTTAQALAAERRRESQLTLLGYPIIRFGPEHLKDPWKLEKLLVQAGIPYVNEGRR